MLFNNTFEADLKGAARLASTRRGRWFLSQIIERHQGGCRSHTELHQLIEAVRAAAPGLSVPEIAGALACAEATVFRHFVLYSSPPPFCEPLRQRTDEPVRVHQPEPDQPALRVHTEHVH